MLKLKKIFSDGIIFQQDTENVVSGTAEAGKKVALKLFKNGGVVIFRDTEADENGKFRFALPPVKGSLDPYALTVLCGDEAITLNDVYFGELFHISGQSNMELPMCRTYDPFSNGLPPEDYPYIREFRVPIVNCFSKTERSDDFAGGEWKSAVGDDLWAFSAAGYYFAEDIFKRLGVPVGLVNTSAGGAMVESFMPYDMIRGYKIHDDFLEKATRDNYLEDTTENNMRLEAEWAEKLGTEDFGLKPSDDMKTCILPCLTSDIPELDGFSGRLFFFKEIDVPEDFPLNGAELILGTITDSDTAYINGIKVGRTDYMYPPRYYKLEKDVLKTGKNTIAAAVEVKIAVLDSEKTSADRKLKSAVGGFTKGRRLCIKSGFREIDLSGEWKYAIAAKTEPMEPAVFFQGLPLALYSNLMAPAMEYKYRALLWYQGESNCGEADMYRQIFGDFVDMYRKECGYEIPVIFTQLCNFEGMNVSDPRPSWAELRNAQLKCLEISSTAMAVTIDIGEYNDLHPTNKREVGKRLAYCAGGLLYGDDTVFVKCIEAKAFPSENVTEIELCFDGNVYLKYGIAAAFEVVFDDGVYHCTTGTEKCGDTVRIICPHSGKAKSVRYAWRNNPYQLDLFDLRMMPVSPFEIIL